MNICSKYGFYIIISEGIMDLHHILFYLYKCHVADGFVMVARGSM